MKAEPGDVVREKLTGKGHIGRVITIDPARRLANIQLPDKVQIFSDHEYEVIFRRGAKQDEPTPRKSSRAKPASTVEQLPKAEPAVQPLPGLEPGTV